MRTQPERCDISIIIPVLNEHEQIRDLLESLQPLRELGNELILVDGGSSDGTIEAVTSGCDQLVISSPGRAIQMNLGAANARGTMLVFLHADSRLPATVTTTGGGLPDSGWGFFPLQLSGEHWLLRWVESGINWRSLFTSIATGDQALFCSRALFDRVGGFPQIALMEDVEFCKMLRKLEPPQVPSSRVLTSSRRWESNGICRTVLLMWWLRLIYWLGCSPERIQRIYSSLQAR